MRTRENKDAVEIERAVRDAGLTVLDSSRYDEVAESIAAQYAKDPLHKWLSGGSFDYETTRQIVLASLKTLGDSAIVYSDPTGHLSYAVWVPTGLGKGTMRRFMQNGGKRLMNVKQNRILNRVFTYELFASRIKKHHVNKDDWYLFSFTVRNDKNSNSLAETMLRPVVDYCWKNKKACYSEMNNLDGVVMLNQVGFQVKEIATVPTSSVEHFVLIL